MYRTLVKKNIQNVKKIIKNLLDNSSIENNGNFELNRTQTQNNKVQRQEK